MTNGIANAHIVLAPSGNGNVGIGTASPANKLDVEGAAVIGATYSGTTAAPPNGLLVQGDVGIGTADPQATLDIDGSLRLSETTLLPTFHDPLAITSELTITAVPTTFGLSETAGVIFDTLGSGGHDMSFKTDGPTRMTFASVGGDITMGRVGGALGPPGGDGNLILTDDASRKSIRFRADGANNAGEISMFADDGVTETVEILGDGGDGNAHLILRNGTSDTVVVDAGSPGQGSSIELFNSANPPQRTILIDAEVTDGGPSRIITDVLEINGADLSENFEVAGDSVADPGRVVCIDPVNPGGLKLSDKAYDRTVAGVISGAGGVRAGVLMGQEGTLATGKHPVALTGRVYVWCDASDGAIQPGDQLTTSSTLGHAMKVADHAAAQGAILGKAMTPLSSGKGLVLVLVSLQ
ncbi:MAG: hypothetical protein AABZ47_09970 [Planctomycetota bacterium]